MNASELTMSIHTGSGPMAVEGRSRAGRSGDGLAEARRSVNQLPLGAWSGPAFDGGRWSPGAAARGIERALVRAAAVSGVAVDVDDTPEDLARRLVQCRVIAAPAADGALALLRVLRHPDDAGDAAKLAERLIGYLDHRPWRQRRRLHFGLVPVGTCTTPR